MKKLSDNYRHLVIMLSEFMITAMLSGATFQTGWGKFPFEKEIYYIFLSLIQSIN